MNQKQRIDYLIKYMLDEDERYSHIEIPQDEEDKKHLLRGLFNIRYASNASDEFIKIQDEYLQNETKIKGIVDSSDFVHTKQNEKIYIWQGDITRLKIDAIVNAANSQMLGCFEPNHSCIDNIIHTMAGIKLRFECDEIMKKQNHSEKTGNAKITKAYNLPSEYVIHTVGPIIHGDLTEEDEKLLESCYKSCLEVASKNNVKSIAFCCISTGVFRFPQKRASEIAVNTVSKFLENDKNIQKVVFNVYLDKDKELYDNLLNK